MDTAVPRRDLNGLQPKFTDFSRQALFFFYLRGEIVDKLFTIMGKIKDNMAKMKCSECARITAYTKRNKKKVKEKLSLMKHCSFCKKHTLHNESK